MNNRVTLPGGISLSRIVVGCMRIGEMKPEEIKRFVEKCLELGVDSFDHAPVYGAYTIEELFGNAVLKDNSSFRQKMKLVTKTGIVIPNTVGNKTIYYDSSVDWIKGEVERSLQKLRTDHIDLLLIHRPDPLMNPEETGAFLDELVKSGKVLSVGVSNFTLSGFNALQSKMKNTLATNQIEISAAASENIFNGQVDNALEKDLALMAWSPLGGGSVFSGKNDALKNVLTEIAGELEIAVDTLLYAWLLRLPAKIIPVTGTTKIERVETAVKALDVKLNHDQWYRILAAGRGFDVP
jgi:predicted oxidoreductase